MAAPKRPQSPTDPGTNSQDTYDWINNPAYTAITDYEYSDDNGTSWITCFEKPIISPATAGIQLRVKATASNFKGNILLLNNLFSVIASNTAPNILIYPNPVKDVLTIENITEETLLSIYSGDGRHIKETTLTEAKNIVDTEDLESGLYILTLRNSTLTKNFKVLKQ